MEAVATADIAPCGATLRVTRAPCDSTGAAMPEVRQWAEPDLALNGSKVWYPYDAESPCAAPDSASNCAVGERLARRMNVEQLLSIQGKTDVENMVLSPVVMQLITRFLGGNPFDLVELLPRRRNAFVRPRALPVLPVDLATQPASLSSASTESRPRRSPRAFCSLLHGSADHFFVYAMTLGMRLKKVNPEIDRVLLCAGPWWKHRACRSALQRVFTSVRHVALVDAPHATLAPRHNRVFTKIQVLRLPYEQLLFLDLDLIPRADLSPLFDLPAPAAMCHGPPADLLEHGQLISDVMTDEDWWCMNAGVMRFDPKPCHEQREAEVDALLQEIPNIRKATMLPEQYFLAERLFEWRHVKHCWNMEVGHLLEDPGFTWPRESARKKLAGPRGVKWTKMDLDEVKVFHFSGRHFQPYAYCDRSPDEAFEEFDRLYKHRDPRQLVGTAIREWLRGLADVVDASAHWSEAESREFVVSVERLREKAAWNRDYHRSQQARDQRMCHRCRGMFSDADGRWLLGWEGWWLCKDCIVGYVASEDEPPELVCVDCGSNAHGQWSWEQVSHPTWRCLPCGEVPYSNDANP